jgi:hypothetical protein
MRGNRARRAWSGGRGTGRRSDQAAGGASGAGQKNGYRVLIAYRSKLRAVFLFGFAKSDLDNIDDDQLATLRETAASWLAADAQKIERAVKDGLLIEVQHDS